MSAEVLTIVISAAALLVTLGGAALGLAAWVIGRIDALGQRLESKLDAQGERLGAVEHELGEVKVAVARLEGPQRRLIVTS